MTVPPPRDAAAVPPGARHVAPSADPSADPAPRAVSRVAPPAAPSTAPAVDPHVLARARARALGAPSIPAAAPVPPGTAAATDGARVWLLPVWPDGATPALLEEYDTAPMPLDRAGLARRVLAAALRCCWRRLDDAPWPGTAATVADVLDVYANMTRGDTDLTRRWATGELRRLADTGWLLLDETSGSVRPGPRVALWAEGSLASLRDLLHRLPEPPAPEPPTPESPEPGPSKTGPSQPEPSQPEPPQHEPSEPEHSESKHPQAGPRPAVEASGASSAPPNDLDLPLPSDPPAPSDPAAEKPEPVDNPPAEPAASSSGELPGTAEKPRQDGDD
ncbi:hypothetical protein [Actinomadura chibensis]|uniref:hypothetical protein n=1 Tax=Actinomadura chibensis TaxID=392828 RepID=UPI000AF4A231|nr:hypothetical protein [Actinomadura chibensis]